MATVYSLVCWGGKDGKQISAASATDIFTLTNHGLRNGTGIVPQTTGGGVTSGVTYYSNVTESGLTANTFYLYDTSAHAIAGGATGRIDVTATITNVYFKSAYYLPLSDKSRWTTGGVERIYNGIVAWNTARSLAASEFDAEVCEIAQNFTDILGSSLSINIPSASALVTTMVNGSRSAGFHNGTPGDGYLLKLPAGTFTLGVGVVVEGFSVTNTATSLIIVAVASLYSGCEGMIVNGNSTSGGGACISLTAAAARIVKCITYGANYGIVVGVSTNVAVVANNLAVKCGVGIYAANTSNRYGYYYNNISVGNGTNWSVQPTNIERASNNAGASGDSPWKTGSNPTVTIATTDFIDYDNDNFRSLLVSPQVNAGVNYYGLHSKDIVDHPIPDYESATFMTPGNSCDAGPFEFDHGEGLAPLAVTISITGMANGSEFAIYKTSDMAEIVAPQSTSGSYSGSYTYTGDTAIVVRVRKGTSGTKYLPYEYSGTITAAGFSLNVSQIIDTIAQ